jgi:hypothetical protein
MVEPEFEYRGMMAKTRDLFRGDISDWEDRDLFLEIIQASGQPGLNLGCGIGRLLVDNLA